MWVFFKLYFGFGKGINPGWVDLTDFYLFKSNELKKKIFFYLFDF